MSELVPKSGSREVAAGSAPNLKIPWVAWLCLLSLSSVWLLFPAIISVCKSVALQSAYVCDEMMSLNEIAFYMFCTCLDFFMSSDIFLVMRSDVLVSKELS